MWDDLAKEFQDGDVLYGLDNGRGAAKAAILAMKRTVDRREVVFCCIPRTRHFERIVIQNDITNSVFDPTRPGLRTDQEILATAKVKSDPERAIGFRSFLEDHPKYSLKDYQPTGVTDDAKAAWLKTSKAGLEFQSRRRSGYNVHFVLDGLDFGRVLEQESEPAQVAQTGIKSPLDITSGEMRWLFRHRQDQDVREAVVFWESGKKTAAPWERPEHAVKFANFLYTKEQALKDEGDSEFGRVLKELKAAVCIQRAFRKHRATYYVRVNDSLRWIAIRHGVSVEDLMRWNRLSSDLIQPGQVLIVQDPAAPGGSSQTIPEGIVQQRRNYFESLASS